MSGMGAQTRERSVLIGGQRYLRSGRRPTAGLPRHGFVPEAPVDAVFATPTYFLEARGSLAADARRPSKAREHGEVPRTRMALDLALGAISRPALVLGRNAEILRANAAAHTLFTENPRGLRHSLAQAIRGRPNRRSWNLTPLQSEGETLGFLAILFAPPPEQAVDEAVRVASGRWKLTARQAEVLELVARGLTNGLVAETLGIGKGTVEFHLSGIFNKAGVSNRATLILRVVEAGRQR